MPYRYRDDVALADVAFEAWGATVEEVFIAAADATMNVMVSDLDAIRRTAQVSVALERETIDLLLFSFLNELVFYKDARQLLLRAEIVSIAQGASGFTLTGVLEGERIDHERHPLSVDVKAVTLHQFSLRRSDNGWEAFVILDI